MALSLRSDKTDRSISDEGDRNIMRPMLDREKEDSVGYQTERLTISDKVQLIKQIKQLRKMIDIYHKEATRMKKKHG